MRPSSFCSSLVSLLLAAACGSAPPSEPVTPSPAAAVSPLAPNGVPAASPAGDVPPPAPLPTTAPPPTAAPSVKAPPEAPPKATAITSVQLSVENKCGAKVEYCVEDGSSLSTSLGSNTSTTHRVSPGAKIKLRKGGGCTDTVYLVTSASADQKATICK